MSRHEWIIAVCSDVMFYHGLFYCLKWSSLWILLLISLCPCLYVLMSLCPYVLMSLCPLSCLLSLCLLFFILVLCRTLAIFRLCQNNRHHGTGGRHRCSCSVLPRERRPTLVATAEAAKSVKRPRSVWRPRLLAATRARDDTSAARTDGEGEWEGGREGGEYLWRNLVFFPAVVQLRLRSDYRLPFRNSEVLIDLFYW